MTTEERMEKVFNIPTPEIEEDIRVTQREIDDFESELESLRKNPVRNRLDIYMREGRILLRKEFIEKLQQILKDRMKK